MVTENYCKKTLFISVLICLVVFYSGFFEIPPRNPLKTIIPKEKINFISGELISSPVKSSSQRFYIASLKVNYVQSVEKIKSSSSGIQQIFIPSEMAEVFMPGKLYSNVKKENAFFYEKGGFYSFSGKMTNGIFFVEKCKSSFWKKTFWGKLNYFRALCRLELKRMLFSWGSAGGLFLALICGSREYIPIDVQNAFKNSGLSHILALSGMHLSLFGGIATFFGKKLKNRNFEIILKTILLSFFIWFAGLSPSLLRAFICNIFIIAQVVSGAKKIDMVLILCFSFLFQAMISPKDLFNVGFMFSYGALFGILLTSEFIKKRISFMFPHFLSDSLSSSVGAQFLTIPISVKTFGTFTPIGIFFTVIVSPLVTFFIYSGLICFLLSLIFPLFISTSGIFMNFLYTLITKIVLFFSQFPLIEVFNATS